MRAALSFAALFAFSGLAREAEARCPRRCAPNLRDPRGCCPSAPPALREAKPKKEATECGGGRVPRGGRCCYPGQAWDSREGLCYGRPEQCPDGMERTDDGCRGLGRLQKTEVTVAEYEACVAASACSARRFRTAEQMEGCNYGDDDKSLYPMNCVDELGAAAYCAWIESELPSDRLWLREATAGGTARFPWGNAPASCAKAQRGGCDGTTAPVCAASKGHTEDGKCDLIGNVAEWLATDLGETRLAAGGHYDIPAEDIGSSHRLRLDRYTKRPFVGFRCLLTRSR